MIATRRASRRVWQLGFTSLFTDISSEMVSSVMPVYLVLHLRLSPIEFGVIDGLYQGMGVVLRLLSAYLADTWRRHKEVACVGYALSAICKLGLLVAGNSWASIVSIVALDRVGKGIRTSPRDALITLSTQKENLGSAFGVHRTLDAGGAMIGPLIAFAVLAKLPSAFDVVFVISFCLALIGLGVIVFLVENVPPAQAGSAEPQKAIRFRAILQLTKERRFRSVCITGGALSLATISDSFLYLTAVQAFGGDTYNLPLLFFATSLCFALFSYPMGRFADVTGRSSAFILGYGALLLVYVLPLFVGLSWVGIVLCVTLLGVYYAATDGVLMAMAGAVLPSEVCAIGMGLLTTLTGIGRLLSSILFGLLWSYSGTSTALSIYAAVLLVAAILSWLYLRVGERAHD